MAAPPAGMHTPIDNLVTLGSPIGWVQPDMSNILNWSNVGIIQDMVAPSWSNGDGTFNQPGAHNLILNFPTYNWHPIDAHSAYWKDPLARSLWQYATWHQGCQSLVSTYGAHGWDTTCGD